MARSADLALVDALVKQHGTLYEAALHLPRLGELQGRGLALVVELGGRVCVVRHFQRGGAVMKAVGDRYLRTTNRALSELKASEAARARGVATPVVVAVAWYSEGIFRRFDIATSFIAGSRDLATDLFDPARSARAVHFTSALINKLLTAGLLHRDLNLKNVLIGRDRAYVLDLDRCRVLDRVTDAQRSAMRARFLRSLEKWEEKTGTPVSKETRRALSEAFGG